MKTDGFTEGQRVKVEYEAIVVSVGAESLHIRRLDKGCMWIGLDKHQVTPLDPADWPPQMGDIWEIPKGALEGYEFFIRQDGAGKIFATPQDLGGLWDLDALKNYYPVLVRRRGQ